MASLWALRYRRVEFIARKDAVPIGIFFYNFCFFAFRLHFELPVQQCFFAHACVRAFALVFSYSKDKTFGFEVRGGWHICHDAWHRVSELTSAHMHEVCQL